MNKTEQNDFSQILLRLKQVLGVHQDQQIADKLGLHQSTIAHKKRKNEFPVEQLKAFIDANPDLKIDFEYVMTGRPSINNLEELSPFFVDIALRLPRLSKHQLSVLLGIIREFEGINAIKASQSHQ